MQLTLSDEEVRTLKAVLEEWLPHLRRELAGTDLPARDLRHELQKRQDLCERLLADLDRPAGGASPAGTS